MSVSVDSPLDETLNRDPLVLLLRQQYEFSFGIDIVQFSTFFQFQFSIFFFFFRFSSHKIRMHRQIKFVGATNHRL